MLACSSAVGLANFDFFAAEMEVFVFGVADGPAAVWLSRSVSEVLPQCEWLLLTGILATGSDFSSFAGSGQLFFFGLDRCRFFFFCRFGRNGFFFGNFVFFLNRGRPSGELQAVNFADDGVFGNCERLQFLRWLNLHATFF